ncbi:hypothetical protein M885DRAFT_148030 [Pelagophyceae sp. CCMP2097]|nr:hypothetical protein M885DRAFT_148030 [Pelagophyceae sp. CCMP2097]
MCAYHRDRLVRGCQFCSVSRRLWGAPEAAFGFARCRRRRRAAAAGADASCAKGLCRQARQARPHGPSWAIKFMFSERTAFPSRKIARVTSRRRSRAATPRRAASRERGGAATVPSLSANAPSQATRRENGPSRRAPRATAPFETMRWTKRHWQTSFGSSAAASRPVRAR